MLCAKYDYKTDIAVQREEAFEEGQEKKAIEAALILIKKYNVTPEEASKEFGAPLDKLITALETVV